MNITNFLPSSGSSSAIIKSAAGGLIPASKTKQESRDTKKQKQYQTTLRKELLQIRSKTIKIEKLLQNSYVMNQKRFVQERKQKENEKRQKREKKLKSKKTKVGNIEIPSIPQFGFLDAIKRFIFFAFLGLALPTLIKIVPKIIEFGKFISPAIKFFADIGKGLLNGLVTFIDWGYKIQDSVANVAKQLGGDGGKKQFEGFVKTLNTFIDLSILAGLTALDVGLDAERFRKQQLQEGKKKGRKPPVKPTTGQGGRPGLGRGANVTQGGGGRSVRGGSAKVTTSRGAQLASGPFAKFAGPIKKFLGAAAPGAGAVIGALDAKARFESGDKIGGTLAATSAALDTFAAAVGVAALASSALALTGIGAAVPAALVSAAGIASSISFGIDLVLLVRDLVKVFFPQIPMFANGGRIKLLAQGGTVGERGRSIKVSRKTPKVQVKQDIQPGKDVGGKQQILKLFPDPSPENKQQTIRSSPWWERWLGINQNQQTQQQIKGKPANPFKALSSTAKTLSKIPGPVGLLMSAGSLIPLGQKPDRNIGMVFGNMMGKLTQDIIDNNINLSFSDIMRFISGYANGGDLRSANIVRENNIGAQVGVMVGKSINMMISTRVDEAVRDIFREISTIGKPPEESLTGDGNGDGNGDGEGETSGKFIGTAADIPPEGKALLDAIAGSESGGYNSRYPSKTFNNNWQDHPRIRERILSGPNKGKTSDAAGRYQFLSSTWDIYKPAKAFTPENQDIAAWKLAIAAYGQGEQGIIKDLKRDPLKVANKLSGTWTSLPGGIEPNNATNGFLSRFKTSVKKYNDLSSQSLTTKGVKKFTRADITSLFGSQESFRKKPHEGMDIAANQGTPISFDMGGKILGVYRTNSRDREANGGYGSYMDIKFSDGKIARMAHLSDIPQSIKTGISFKANQIIAYSGGEEGSPGAGRSGGPHIHLEQLSKPMGIEETIRGKYDPLKGGLFQRIQKGGTLTSSITPLPNSQLPIKPVSLAPTKPSTIAQGLDETLYYNQTESQQIAFVPIPIIINKSVPVSTDMVNNNITTPQTVNFDITPSLS